VAMAALRNKKTKELELDRIAGTRLTLETQVCVLCSGAAEQSRLALSTASICSLGTNSCIRVHADRRR
jgi:hypothetical protein